MKYRKHYPGKVNPAKYVNLKTRNAYENGKLTVKPVI